MKDDILEKKNTWTHDIFFKSYGKVFFPKKVALKYDLSCIHIKHDIHFSRKYDLILSAENER